MVSGPDLAAYIAGLLLLSYIRWIIYFYVFFFLFLLNFILNFFAIQETSVLTNTLLFQHPRLLQIFEYLQSI